MNLGRCGGLAMVCLLPSAVPVFAKPTAVTAEVNLRAAPGTNSQILTLIPKGASVELATCGNGWCQVSWNGQQGYVVSRSVGVHQSPPRPRHSAPQVYAQEASPPPPPVYVQEPPPPPVYPELPIGIDPPPVYIGPPYGYYGGYYGYNGPYYGPRWGFGWNWGRRYW